MHSEGVEAAIPESEKPQTHALDPRSLKSADCGAHFGNISLYAMYKYLVPCATFIKFTVIYEMYTASINLPVRIEIAFLRNSCFRRLKKFGQRLHSHRLYIVLSFCALYIIPKFCIKITRAMCARANVCVCVCDL